VGAAFSVVTAAATAFVSNAVSAANEQLAAEKQLETVLKSTGSAAGMTAEELKRLASEMQSLTTYGDETVIGAENILLTFTNIGKEVFPQALEAVLNMSTALGQDLKSSSIQLGKALQDPILGMTALRRVGVNFGAEQVELVKNMIATGDTMGAQKFILAELSREFGGSAAAAAETFQGKMIQLRNKIGDIREEIGFAFIPTLFKFAEWLNPIIDRTMQWFDANQNLGQTIATVTQQVFTDMLPALKEVGRTIAGVLKRIFEWVKANPELTVKLMTFTAVIGPLSIALNTLVMGLGSVIKLFGAMTILANPYVAAIVAITAGVAALGEMFIKKDWYDNFLTRAIDKWIPALGRGIDIVMDKLVALKNMFVRTPSVQLGAASQNAIKSGRVSASGSGTDSLQSARFGCVNINMGGVIIREQADINRIADELGRRVDRSLRARGALA